MTDASRRPGRNLPIAPLLSDGRAAIKRWLDDLLAVGVHSFTVDEAHDAIGGTLAHVRAALSRLAAAGRLVRPAKGFYVIVTPEHRLLGAPPPSWYIDPMMDHVGLRYYVTLLSAAALYGAAPQAPQEFQIMTTRYRPAKTVGRTRLRWIVTQNLALAEASERSGGSESTSATDPLVRASAAVVRINTPTGTMWVATPETTAVDLVEYAHRAGDLSHVASVLDALAESLRVVALTAACVGRGPTAQRLGYLLDTLGYRELAKAVGASLAPSHPGIATTPDTGADTGSAPGLVTRCRPVALSVGVPAANTPLDARWAVYVNDTIEPE